MKIYLLKPHLVHRSEDQCYQKTFSGLSVEHI